MKTNIETVKWMVGAKQFVVEGVEVPAEIVEGVRVTGMNEKCENIGGEFLGLTKSGLAKVRNSSGTKMTSMRFLGVNRKFYAMKHQSAI